MDHPRPRRPVKENYAKSRRPKALFCLLQGYLAAISSGNKRPLGILTHCCHNCGNFLIEQQRCRMSLLHAGRCGGSRSSCRRERCSSMPRLQYFGARHQWQQLRCKPLSSRHWRKGQYLMSSMAKTVADCRNKHPSSPLPGP